MAKPSFAVALVSAYAHRFPPIQSSWVAVPSPWLYHTALMSNPPWSEAHPHHTLSPIKVSRSQHIAVPASQANIMGQYHWQRHEDEEDRSTARSLSKRRLYLHLLCTSRRPYTIPVPTRGPSLSQPGTRTPRQPTHVQMLHSSPIPTPNSFVLLLSGQQNLMTAAVPDPKCRKTPNRADEANKPPRHPHDTSLHPDAVPVAR